MLEGLEACYKTRERDRKAMKAAQKANKRLMAECGRLNAAKISLQARLSKEGLL